VLLATPFAAWGLCFGEICWAKGWRGLAWLSGFNWSAVPICALIVAECCWLMDGRRGWPARMKFFGAGFVTALAAFVLERATAFELFSGGAPSGLTARVAGTFLLGTALVPTLFPLISNRWLNATHWRAPLYLVVALLFVLPLSFATIRLLPALNGSTDEIHALKMGYPAFWTALLVPLALWLGKRKPAPSTSHAPASASPAT